MAIAAIKKVTSAGVTLATSTNNQVATVTGANALTGESNLTFDGSRLDVTGEVRASTGVLFGSDTAVANLLDDYEEGAWTPVWKFGTTTNTVSDEQAWYSKIGRTVTVWYRGYLGGGPNGTGNLTIEGLPYATTNTTNRITSTAIWWNLINFDSVAITAAANATTVSIVGLTNSTSVAEANVTNSNCTTYTQLRFAFSYQSAS